MTKRYKQTFPKRHNRLHYPFCIRAVLHPAGNEMLRLLKAKTRRRKIEIEKPFFAVVIRTMGGLSFISPYQGRTVRGSVGSSLQFNWSFTGNVGLIKWGVSRADDPLLLDDNQILFSLLKTGQPGSFTTPVAYVGRVTGSRTNGLVIFTLHKLKTDDTRFYVCTLSPMSPGITISDHVQLVVEGPPNIVGISANQTVNEANGLTLNCTTSGNPSPNTTWTRLWDNRVVSMPLTNIRRQDEGGYRCTANNGIGNPVSKDVFITVHYKPSITSMTPLTKQSWIGQRVQLKCVADGSPTPSITWTKPDGTKLRKVTSTENTVDAKMIHYQDFGNYTCEASNVVGAAATRWVRLNQIKPPGSPNLTANDNDIRASSLIIKWTTPVDDGGSPITGYNLVILHGDNVILKETTSAAVREYFVDSLNKSTTYTLRVSATNKAFQGAANEKKVTTKYEGAPATVEIIGLPSETRNVSLTVKWNEPENNGAPITQFTVYQRIVNSDKTVGKWKKIRVIKDLSRRQVVVELEKNKVYDFAVTATNKYGESLPEGKNIRKLVVLGDIPEPIVIVKADIADQKITFTWNKPEENGAAITQYTIYKRNVNDQKWTKVAEIKDISNRVFVVQLEKVKTYEIVVTATNKYGESSVIKENIKTIKLPDDGASQKPPEGQKGSCTILHSVYNSFVIFLVIIIIVLSVGIWKMRRRPCPRCGDLITLNPVSVEVKDNIELRSDSNTNEAVTYATSVAGGGYYMPLHPSGRSWEVSREDVHVIKMIGKGAFSQVAQGRVKNLQANQEETTVAIKMLKANAPPSDRKDLLSELELMKKLKPHPHVIKLIGCVTGSDPIMVLIEYVPCGDLLGYLRKSRGLNDTYYKNPDEKPETNLTAEQLMKFAWQVADGMCYLTSKKIIHRDLAARNVLVGEGERCKVTDFGMARNVEQDDIYTKTSRGRLPVKWTAYEALFYGVYTTQSDVWSYGVLLYEILTVGGSPYPDINARLIPDKIQKGYRMPKPRHVDNKLYEITMKCWEKDPSDRPTFEKLRKTMKDMERNHKTYVNLSQYDTRLYANITDLAVD
ncbi:tyrosine-protein kinase receptor Tie-1-like isoform X3 [Montipora capricornis]|uniref:tyrosine-protein kinase receptor Tie-1-like isoform X3 n=1 Tax=Montipora capricornis TaxID=246305 RepID=UPI0035F1ADC7